MKRKKQYPDAGRRLRQAARHSRTLRVLQLIQSKGRWNAKNIAAELECSERTVYRDLDVLELAGVPWFFDEGERCYRVRHDFRFPVVNLGTEELIGQATATAITSAAGLDIGRGAKPTTRKLAATSSDKSAAILADAEQIVEVLDLKLADHSRCRDVIRTAQHALLERKQLAATYESPYQKKPVKLILHPYRLVLVQQAWYLVARPKDRDQPKTYRMMRFNSLRMLETPVEVPIDFDLRRYFGNAWAVYRGSESYQVTIEFTPEAAPLVTETVWHSTQKVSKQKGGRVRLRFTVDGLDEILWWVLGWSGRAKVIEPEKLREMVCDQLRSAIKLNERATESAS
jgi:predicted DNA-binding transcriptional regulator YafY